MRVLIVPDKFKGTLTATAAARAIASGWRRERPSDTLELLPMSDGGDGFGELMGRLLKATTRRTVCVNAANRRLTGKWWYSPQSGTAVIDAAGIVGLAMLRGQGFHPFDLDTFGLGMVIRRAAHTGAKKAIVGIGGSATNDGGFGMARALGWKFIRKDGSELTRWIDLHGLQSVEKPVEPLRMKVTAAVDVANPLLGPDGCTRIYGPQKGLSADDFAQAEQCLTRLAEVTRETLGIDYAGRPGAGAAGGLGFALMAFAGAKTESGFKIFSNLARFRQRIDRADLVITGEGRIDRQTAMGKGVGAIAQLCRKAGVPCLAIAGTVDESAPMGGLFESWQSLEKFAGLEAALAEPARYLRKAAGRMAASFAFSSRQPRE